MVGLTGYIRNKRKKERKASRLCYYVALKLQREADNLDASC
jgi:hypothetical protein